MKRDKTVILKWPCAGGCGFTHENEDDGSLRDYEKSEEWKGCRGRYCYDCTKILITEEEENGIEEYD